MSRHTQQHCRFPRHLIQVWFQGREHFQRQEPIVCENTKFWKQLNPHWNHSIVDEAELRQACQAFSLEAVQTFDELHRQAMIMAIDFGRYCFLYQKGGMYIDVDTYPIRPIESCPQIAQALQMYESGQLANILILSVANNGQLSTTVDLSTKNPWFLLNNGVMISSKSHPLVKYMIQDCIDKCLSVKQQPFSSMLPSSWRVMTMTGPSALTRSVQRHLQNKKSLSSFVIILPCSVFEPCTLAKICMIENDTVSIHYHKQSWVPSFWERFGRFFTLMVHVCFQYRWLWISLFCLFFLYKFYFWKQV